MFSIKNILHHLSSVRIIIPMVLLPGLFLTGCTAKSEPVSQTGFAFNTVISITLYEKEKNAQPLFEECFQKCTTYENLFSRTIEGSDVYRINHADGSPVSVSSETLALVQDALHYAELSHGVVDPTIGPLSEIWNFSGQAGSKNPIVPDAKQIDTLLTHVNYKNVIVSGNTVTLSDPDAILDLGFIAKGYIADQLKDYLVSQGITSGIINLGGNVLTIGDKPDGSTYNIGIQKPFDQMNAALLAVPVSNSSVVSSGCYERYFYKNDKLYHHILDTSTGYPVENNLYGVSILSSSSTEGDALSTLVYSLGLEKGMELIESTPGVEAIFVTNEYEIHKTSGLSNL